MESIEVTNSAGNFELAKLSHVAIDVYDLPGKKLFSVANELFSPGAHHINLNNQLPAGVFFLKMNVDGMITTKKFVVMN